MHRFVALLVLLATLMLASLALADSVSVSSSIPADSTLKGCVRWDVTVSPPAAGVRYFIAGEPFFSGETFLTNGVLVSSTATSDSFRYGDGLGSGYFDVRQIPPGSYALSVVALDSTGVEIGRIDENVVIGTGAKNCATRGK